MMLKVAPTAMCDVLHERDMPLPKTGATHYHAQLGLSDKGWGVEPSDLLNRLALCFYQLSFQNYIWDMFWRTNFKKKDISPIFLFI